MNQILHINLNQEGSYTLNYDEIFKEIAEKGIINKKLLIPSWKNNLIKIIEEIGTNLEKGIGEIISLNLKLDLESLNRDSSFKSSNEKSELIKNENQEITKNIKKIKWINRNIEYAINSIFSIRWVIQTTRFVEISWKHHVLREFNNAIINNRAFNNQIEIDNNFWLNFEVNQEQMNLISHTIDELYTTKIICIDIELRFFLRRFLQKINIYSDLTPSIEEEKKEDFIQKFTNTKNEKHKIGERYLKMWIAILGIVLLIDCFLFGLNFNKTKTLTTFIEGFLWNWIYILFIQLILVIVGLFFIKQFNFYSKLTELYESNISLIESDFHYKNDNQLYDVNHDLVFQMRKENTQKIHNLPERVTELFCLKNDVKSTTELSTRVIDKLIDKL